MKVQLNFAAKSHKSGQLVLIGVSKKKDKLAFTNWPANYLDAFKKMANSKTFKGDKGEIFYFALPSGNTVGQWAWVKMPL